MTSTSSELQELLKQDILQSVSIADELDRRAEEIEWLRGVLLSRDNKLRHQAEEIERLRQQVTQRGARMQMMRVWLESAVGIKQLIYGYREAADWFDADGAPK